MSTEMQYVRLGRTDLKVSVVGLGCGGGSRLGLRSGHDMAHATRVVEHAIDRGVNLIDTALAYGTEPAVGQAIRTKRDQVVVSTKSVSLSGPELPTPAQLAAGLEESLRNLGTDYIDVYHLYSTRLALHPDAIERLLPEMQRQQKLGKIRHIGATEVFNRDPAHHTVYELVTRGVIDVAMLGFNLLNPSARRNVFPYSMKHDVGTLIMFAVRNALSRPPVLAELVAGLIASGEIDPKLVDAADPLGFVRDHPDVGSIPEAAYRFCHHEPGADVVLTGTGDIAHLDANIDAILSPPLPAELTDRLNAIFGQVDTVSGQ